MLRFHRTVQFLGIRPELLAVLPAIDGYFTDVGVDWYITHAVDGTHSPGSSHYRGCALRIDILEADEADFFGYAADIDDILPLEFTVSADISYITLEYNPRKGVSK